MTATKQRPHTANVIRQVRDAFDLTQEQVAERAGLKRVHYNKLESGHLKASTARVHKALAKAYGASLDDVSGLLDGRVTVAEFCRRAKVDREDVREGAAGGVPQPPAVQRLDETPLPPSHTSEFLKLAR